MINRDTFSSYHPLVNFVYFGLVLAFSMIFVHPVCLGISLICALTYAIYLNGKKAVRFSLLFMLPVFVITVLMNPAFNHEGGTILTYLPSGNPLTLESMVYGMVAATMLIGVISWFSCYNAVMTSDKFVYLFGRVIPALSLILSMVLRFVPRFKTQLQVVSNAQRCIGRDISSGGVLQRARKGLTILSVMVTWSLENAIETADSMKSRGYGLEGRTAFSIYSMDRRDGIALLFLTVCGLYIIAGAFAGGLYFRYFPTIKGVSPGLYPFSLFICYAALCLMPVILNVAADARWRALETGNSMRKEESQIESVL
ncbi:energy-coupling factor transporter transmembrane component T [Aminipila butyrica]